MKGIIYLLAQYERNVHPHIIKGITYPLDIYDERKERIIYLIEDILFMQAEV